MIDTDLVPEPAEVELSSVGPRPVAVVEDSDGVATLFVADEVIVTPKDQAELDAFISRTGGTIIETNEVPQPPATLREPLDLEQTEPTEFTVRVDPAMLTADSLAADGTAAGLSGERRFSSEAGAKLWALVFRELENGLEVIPNYVHGPDGEFLESTEEQPTATGFDNALAYDGFGDTGAKSNVAKAWQFVAAHGWEPVNVAIIDGGFWVDNNGIPMSADPSGVSDLATVAPPVQYDFVNDDYVAAGMNPATCGKDEDGFVVRCPWHGNNSAGAAAGFLNNRYGGAGSGGQVSVPFLFLTDIRTHSQVTRAIRTAVEWGARVVNMSFGGPCNLDCVYFGKRGRWILYGDQLGVTFVTSAGNKRPPINVDEDPKFPCNTPAVICVGAIERNSNTPMDYSNYGSVVDIWAPTEIPVMANGTTTPNQASAGGTSASSPFVAGVIAMMKAMDPTLTPDEVRAILTSTAWTDAPDAKVTRYLNAYPAVLEAADGKLPADLLEPNDTQETARPLLPGDYPQLTVHDHGNDVDWYSFSLTDYGSARIRLRYVESYSHLFHAVHPAQPIPGVPEQVSSLSYGRQILYDMLPPGTYRFILTAYDPSLYEFNLTLTATGLQPDQFEVNDTFAASANVVSGSYLVSRHTDTDPDYYLLDSVIVLPGIKDVVAGVRFADQPVTMALLDDQGGIISERPAATEQAMTVGSSGTYSVFINGAARTRYMFYTKGLADKSNYALPAWVDELWWFEGTGRPTVDWLIEQGAAYVFTQSADVLGAYNSITEVGSDLSLTLLDSTGVVVATSEPFEDGDVPAARISIDGTSAGQDYVLLVERPPVDPIVGDTPGAALPALQYSLSFAPD